VVDSTKLVRLFSAAKAVEPPATIRVVVDSEIGLSAIAKAAAETKFRAQVMIKVNTGLGRVGVDPGTDALEQLDDKAKAYAEQLEVVGVYSHAGHSYGKVGVEAMRAVCAAERDVMHDARRRLLERRPDGTSIAICCGATPGSVALSPDCCTKPVGGSVVECSAGNYVFLDQGGVDKGLTRPSFLWTKESLSVSLCVVATVVSKSEGYFIIDAGSKVLSSDKGAHAAGGASFGSVYPGDVGEVDLSQRPPLMIEKLSEEHGWVSRASSELDLALGSRVCIVPMHSCPVVNLAESILVTGFTARRKHAGDDASATVRWTVDARGTVR